MLKNAVSGEVKELQYVELLNLFPEPAQVDIQNMVGRLEPSHLVVYTNMDLSSSRVGKRQVMAAGDNCTYSLKQAVEAPLGDLPSNFKYPEFYAEVPSAEEE